MAVPKGFKKDLKIALPETGEQRRRQLFNNIGDQKTFLPRGILSRDIDYGFVNFIENDIAPVIKGEQVPTYFFVMQRWSEFEQTWGNSDQFKNIKIPFVTVVREPNTEVGTNQAGNWNIPGDRTYAYMKVPTWDGNRKGFDIYKIPQPTSVDFLYDVRLFANRHEEINRYQEILQKTFRARQHYIFINGHPMPITLESIDDETRNELEGRRYYVITCRMRLAGYLMDEDDMEVVPAKSRALVFQEVTTNVQKYPKINVETDIESDNITYDFVFKSGSRDNFSFKLNYDVEFYGADALDNISSYTIKRNGTVMNFPFIGNANDTIKVEITRTDNTKESRLRLKGTIKS